MCDMINNDVLDELISPSLCVCVWNQGVSSINMDVQYLEDRTSLLLTSTINAAEWWLVIVWQ